MDIVIPLVVAAVMFTAALMVFPLPPSVHDSYGYTMTGQRLLYDGVFSFSAELPGTPVTLNARVTPGYPLFLAAVYAVFGRGLEGPIARTIAVQPYLVSVQLLLGLFIVLVIARTGRLLGGPRLGLTAGLAAALYPPFALAASVALGEQLGTALFACQIWLAIALTAPRNKRSLSAALGFGALTAATAMVRPALIGWAVLPLLYIAVRRLESPKRVVYLGAVAALGFALVWAPWWVRNYRVMGTFVPIRTDAVAPGAEPVTPSNPYRPGQDVVSPAIPQYPEALKQIAWAQVVPAVTTAEQTLQAVRAPWIPQAAAIYEDVFHPDEQRVGFTPSAPENPEAFAFLDGYARWYHWLVLAGAFIGLFFIPRSPRLILLAAVPLYIIGAHYGVQVNIRYLYPMMPAVVLLAAAGFYGAGNIVTRSAHAGTVLPSPPAKPKHKR